MRTLVAALLFASFSSTAAAQCDCAPPGNWQTSFIPPDPIEATEVRQFATFGDPIALYAATGSWMDQGSPKGTAHVIRLDSSSSKWVDEVNFGDGTTGALVTIHWTKDQNYNPIDSWTLVASIWSGATVFQKTNGSSWTRTSLNPNGQIRAFVVHDDKVASEFWGFAGGKPGIYRGQLVNNAIQWLVNGAAKLELDTTDLESPQCTGGGRVTGFAEANGKLFASACWTVFQRIDGLIGKCDGPTRVEVKGKCQDRWQPFWTDPLAANGESGIRGLTQVKHEGKQVLLAGSESGNTHITRIDPDTGNSVVEFNVNQYLDNLWGLNAGYAIIPYNAPANLWYGPDGFGRRMFGFEVWLPGNPTPGMARKLVNIDDGSPQVMNGEGFFFLRNSATSYQLFQIPAITPQPMTAIRDMIASPFKDECNEAGQDCVIYAGFFDANKSTTQTPCTEAPCTFPPLVAVPTHRTGGIVKGRIILDSASRNAPISARDWEPTLTPHRRTE